MAADLRVICHHALLSLDTVDQLSKRISVEFDHLRAQMVNGTWCQRGTQYGGGRDQTRSNLQHLLVNCLRILDLLPTFGCPSLTLVTDGTVTMPNEQSLLDMAGEP